MAQQLEGEQPGGDGLAVLAGLSLLLFALHMLFNGRYGYFVDELYYLACSHHLDWGYVDQPPLIAGVTWLERVSLGDSLHALRFLPAVAARLKVKATPRLHSDHEVTLQMEIEIRSLANTQLNGVPVISNRTIDQTVRLREDESTALAGILQPSEMRTLTGWPWFAQGGRHDAQRQDAELLILVTPRLLRLAPRLDRSFYAGHGAGTAAGPAGLSQRAEPIPH